MNLPEFNKHNIKRIKKHKLTDIGEMCTVLSANIKTPNKTKYQGTITPIKPKTPFNTSPIAGSVVPSSYVTL